MKVIVAGAGLLRADCADAVEDGRAVVRPVTPGLRTGLAVQIEDGLSEGTQVVIHPGDDVEDGVRIRIR